MTRRPVILLAAAGALALTACTDPRYAPGGERERTRQGGIAGAVVGAAVGAAMPGSNDLQQAAIGAAIGTIAGSAIGASLDRQRAALDTAFDDDRVRVVNTGSELVVTMPQDILFATGSDAIGPALQADLADAARVLRDFPDSTIQVIGHTDNTGTAEFNKALSERRAIAVRQVLVANGVAANRVVALGMGEDQPVATNLTPEGRALNRRVEIIIRPT